MVRYLKEKYGIRVDGKHVTICSCPTSKSPNPQITDPIVIYLSGSITNDIENGLNWRKKFREYETFLKRFYPNASFFNPGRELPGSEYKPDHPVDDLKTWQYNTVMRRDLSNLLDCDAIAFLPDWKKSKGAKCEKKVAECIGIKMIKLPEIRI